MVQADFNGEWIGLYPGHHEEVIRIVHSGRTLEAMKVTGDNNVPAGEVTWRATLDDSGSEGAGEGQIADDEFRNPRFVPGTLRVEDRNHIAFTWTGLGSVEYRRDI